MLEIKRKIISELLGKGILANKEILESINSLINISAFYKHFEQKIEGMDKSTEAFVGLVHSYNKLYVQNQAPSWVGTETKPETKPETKKPETTKDTEDPGNTERPRAPLETEGAGGVEIVFSYEETPKKREIQDFVKYFNARYNVMRKILADREELANLNSVSRIQKKKEKGEVAIIGLISDKVVFKSGTIMLYVEDPTGIIKVMIKEDHIEAYKTAKESNLDEIIGVVGTNGEDIIFANNIVLPDIPENKELKKSPDEANAIFIGDFHYGSKVFVQEAFDKFLSWIRAEKGNDEQKEAARKVKYVFLLGDLVEGVGIYPKQEEHLLIKDIYKQYEAIAKQLAKIPTHIKIIICPGNHDAMRIAEPQPPLYKDFAEAIWNLPNVVMVSNPSYVNIHKSEVFSGINVLLYHGFSFIYYADMVESIRSNGGAKRPDLIMEYLLRRRHLAPAHKSTLYLPNAKFDPLVIDKVPDVFASGHIHRVSASNYRNVTMLNCSCWLKTTEFQEKVGVIPQTGRAVLMELHTRKVKILKFYEDPKEEIAEIKNINE